MMARYLVRRLVQAVPTVLGVTLLIFVLVRVIPGDPAGLLFGQGTPPTPAQLAGVRRELGLDRPIWVQYVTYVIQAAHGDLGRSYQANVAVSAEILKAAPATLELTLGAILVAIVCGVTAGVVAAIRQDSLLDYGTIVIASLGMSAPVFWIGLMLILLFAVELPVLPAAGPLDPRSRFVPMTNFYVLDALLAHNAAAFWDALRHLVLPSLALGFNGAALIARIARASMLDVLTRDYVTTAHAKGLAERAVILRHGLRTALIPIITVIGLQVGYLLGGAVLTEAVFSWPGLGTLLVSAIFARDYPTIQGVALFVSVSFVLVNLVVDILYAWFDPTVRYA